MGDYGWSVLRRSASGLVLFNRLPQEILEMIAEKLELSDIENMSLVCKAFHRRLFSRLHQELLLVSEEEHHIDFPSIWLTKTYFDESGLSKVVCPWNSTRLLSFNVPMLQYQTRACLSGYHFWTVADGQYDAAKSKHHDELMGQLSYEISDICESLVEHKLREFRWHTGCCIPDTILGKSGYLPLKQTALTSLSLVTDGSCKHTTSVQGLLQLNRLQSFSWRGLGSLNGFDTFRTVLQNNAKHLTKLEIGLLNESHWNASRGEILIRIGLILPNSSNSDAPRDGNKCFRIDALRHLSLINIPVESYSDENSFPFDPRKLQSLKLQFCDGDEKFFTTLMQYDIGLNLRTLHFAAKRDETLQSLATILDSFSGLEQLHLLIGSRAPSLGDIMKAVYHSHGTTLKQFLFHNLDDYLPMGTYFHHRKIMKHLPALEYLSIWSELGGEGKKWPRRPHSWAREESLEKSIKPSKRYKSLKVLHFRMEFLDIVPQDLIEELIKQGYPLGFIPSSILKSRKICRYREDWNLPHDRDCLPYLFKFARWAFGPKGMPNLQVIAYGDFVNERHQWSRLLLSRCQKKENNGWYEPSYDLPFRVIDPGNRHGWAGDDKAWGFLCEDWTTRFLDSNFYWEGYDCFCPPTDISESEYLEEESEEDSEQEDGDEE